MLRRRKKNPIAPQRSLCRIRIWKINKICCHFAICSCDLSVFVPSWGQFIFTTTTAAVFKMNCFTRPFHFYLFLFGLVSQLIRAKLINFIISRCFFCIFLSPSLSQIDKIRRKDYTVHDSSSGVNFLSVQTQTVFLFFSVKFHVLTSFLHLIHACGVCLLAIHRFIYKLKEFSMREIISRCDRSVISSLSFRFGAKMCAHTLHVLMLSVVYRWRLSIRVYR